MMTLIRPLRLLAVAALVALLLAACGSTTAPAAVDQPATAPTIAPTSVPAAATAVSQPSPEPSPTSQPTTPPTPSATPTPAGDAPGPVQQQDTATPAQAQATGQPNAVPGDQDAGEPAPIPALAAAFPGSPQADGEVIFVTGKVFDVQGNPLPGAVVEIWQTDAQGIYDHPGDPGTAGRDTSFQFYGQSVAAEDGTYLFRTVMPGRYEPRPRHIHVKVKLDGAAALTTQFYFEEDRAGLQDEGLFRQAGSLGELLILKQVDGIDVDGATAAVLANDLVIDAGGGSGPLTPTPSQGQGPYYPVATLANYDNDLTIVE